MIIRSRIALPIVWILAAGSLSAATPDNAGGGPRLELHSGEKYFRAAGRPTFVLGRNPAGKNPQAYAEHFRQAAAAGERFMRIHFTYHPPGEKAGHIDPGMLQGWDTVLDAAEKQGLAVLPVLDVWSEWNDGSRQELWHRWEQSAFNAALGGPAQRPAELFDDGPCRRLWLARLETFVKHWAHRRAIVGWEVFSEIDLITGATEDRTVVLAELAAAVVRAADPWRRPVTMSQSGIVAWPKLLRSPALDFIEIHPYSAGPFGGRLDEEIITAVRERLREFGKAVLIGECGLDFRAPRGTLDVAPRAAVGIQHAIWAGVVSGALNGRALWWQDGYDQFEKADVCRHYHQAAASAAAFVRDVDFTAFAPLACVMSAGVKGAVLGHATSRLGWFRDVRCVPPEWPLQPTAGQHVTLDAPDNRWQIEFFDPESGTSTGKALLTAQNHRLRIDLPQFSGSIAVQLRRLAP